ncbi:MAG: RdgB/HAM1 family non-canonical purine NTP pyrophosphatase [Oscillospiraceae bacterium]|nr:RdgB/HAM1 family non-canonical purine NTP pyrophosphatase [Oscillospiraceae bacterium]
MTTILIATHNAKKQIELERILAPNGYTVALPRDIGITLPEVEETEDTFLGNALLKARSACAVSGLPCVADDSGLCVDALGGAPGVYSARYGGKHGDDRANNALLLKNLRDTPDEKRTARFVCAAVCVYPDGRELVAEEVCEGIIAREPRGDNGFGYDPLFLPVGMNGLTAAQLDNAAKDAISHRGKALRALEELM